MMHINTLFARHGFKKADVMVNEEGFMTRNGLFFDKVLSMVSGEMIFEYDWMNIVKDASRKVDRAGREALIDSERQEIPLADLDTHIRGITRWLNELGMYTEYSCDGHNTRPAYVYLKYHLTLPQMKLIRACAVRGIEIRFSGKKVLFQYHPGEIVQLLNIAERLHALTINPDLLTMYEGEQFKHRIIDLLSISGSSGNERRIRQYLQLRLRKFTDYTYVDHAGNLLGYLYCGDGPTILLSAHMDTVEEFAVNRQINEKGTVLSSSQGILGADDRAGIAVILEILSRVQKTNFNGTIKIALTVKEEIGCVGSSEIDQSFLDDVDGAIVVDRRGTRDIVISNGGVAFCSDDYGLLFKKAGKLSGMNDWDTTPGGLSDAKVFSSYGIPSVNLSVGYMNEHSDFETLDYLATYETVKLIETVLHHQMISSNRKLDNKKNIICIK